MRKEGGYRQLSEERPERRSSHGDHGNFGRLGYVLDSIVATGYLLHFAFA